MKITLTILVFLSFTLAAHAEKKLHFHFRKGIELKIPSDKGIVYTQFKNVLYYTESALRKSKENYTSHADSFKHVVYTYNLLTEKNDSVCLVFPLSADPTGFSGYNIAVSDDYIGMTFDSLYLFKLSSGLNLFRTVNGYHNNNISFCGDGNIFIYKNYNNHPLDDSVNTKFVLYNIDQDRVAAYTRPVFNYVCYTHLVGNYMDVADGLIAFTQTMPYEIDFFSTKNLQKLADLKGEQFINDSKTLNTIDSLHKDLVKTNEMKRVLYAVMKDDSIIRIEKIYFLDDNTLLVSKTIPKSNYKKRMLDVWKYENKKWQRIIYNQQYETEKSDEYMITEESLPLNLTFSNRSISADHNLFVVSSKVPPSMGIMLSEYKKNMDSYYENHDINYFIWEYAWEIK